MDKIYITSKGGSLEFAYQHSSCWIRDTDMITIDNKKITFQSSTLDGLLGLARKLIEYHASNRRSDKNRIEVLEKQITNIQEKIKELKKDLNSTTLREQLRKKFEDSSEELDKKIKDRKADY